MQKKCGQASMPSMGFEATIPVLERAISWATISSNEKI
jgi:hypothetical protein